MTRQEIESFIEVLIGITFIIAGLIIHILRQKLFINISIILGIILIVKSFVDFYQVMIKQKKYHHLFMHIVVQIIGGITMIVFPYFNIYLGIRAFGVFCLFDSVIKLITYYQYQQNKVPLRLFLLCDGLIFFTLGLSFIIIPHKFMQHVFTWMAVYLTLLGLRYIYDGLESKLRKENEKLVRKFRINLPVLFSAYIPHRSLKQYINHELLILEGNEDEVDLEVLVHVAPQGHNALGHVDLCFKDKVVSYGNYDRSSYRLFDAVGEGVLFVADKETYIPFCQTHTNKTIFGYGLKLTDKQKAGIYEKLEEIKKNTYEWDPPAKRDPEHKDDYKEYASMLYKRTGASFYKFKTGRFKSFFVLSTNCVLLADSIVGKAGIDLLNINGMISPGTYYDYFEKELHKKNSMVISKKVYHLKKEE